jgi:hypothetical protein
VSFMMITITTPPHCLLQLLRIEEEGAYAGLVNGAPTLNNARQKQSKVRDDSHDDDVSDLDGDSRCASEQRNSAALSPQQQRTLRQLVSGVTRWRRQLDYVISHVTSRSVTQLDSDIRQVGDGYSLFSARWEHSMA